VDILRHPTGRILGRRPSFAIDMDAVLEAAAELGVAVEINRARTGSTSPTPTRSARASWGSSSW
jgi:histidinol phosphatase-like PHP family hydrolase